MGEEATGGTTAWDGYVKVDSAPYAYDQSPDADDEYLKGAPLRRSFSPRVLGVAGSRVVGWRVLHLFLGQGIQWIREEVLDFRVPVSYSRTIIVFVGIRYKHLRVQDERSESLNP